MFHEKGFVIALIACLLLTMAACSPPNQLVSPANSPLPLPADTNETQLIVEIWGSQSWPAVLPELRIWEDGKAMWAKYTESGPEVLERQLSEQELSQIVTLIETSGFFDLERVIAFNPTEGVMEEIYLAYRNNDRAKRVSLNFQALPDHLIVDLRREIFAIVGNEGTPFVPQQGYLTVWHSGEITPNTVRLMSTAEFTLDFTQPIKNRLVTGPDLVKAWAAMKQGGPPITSETQVYSVWVNLPGLTCVMFKTEEEYKKAVFCPTL